MSWNEEFSLELKITNTSTLSDDEKLALIHDADSLDEVEMIMNKKPLTEKEIIQDFRETYIHAFDALDVLGCSDEIISWSKANDELAEFSEKYPNVLFILTCEDREEGTGLPYKVYASKGRIASIKPTLCYPAFYEDRFIAGEIDFIIDNEPI